MLIAISKGMLAVKLCSSTLTGGLS